MLFPPLRVIFVCTLPSINVAVSFLNCAFESSALCQRSLHPADNGTCLTSPLKRELARVPSLMGENVADI